MQWQFWVDCGGTFTDFVARSPDGNLLTHKLLSKNPEHYEDPVIEGLRQILGVGREDPLPEDQIDSVKMGTTLATNALLERKGEPTALVVTRGFADQLKIGYQNRPNIFACKIEQPKMLYEKVVEVEERISAQGEKLVALDELSTRSVLSQLYKEGFRSLAIVFIHGSRYPDHEKRVAFIAKDMGFTQVSVSYEVSPLVKFVSRGDTTLVDAYVSPILKHYVNRLSSKLGNTRLMFMQSNGGLVEGQLFRGKDAILSGPAGGMIGAVQTAQAAGFNKIISFDMGGTSTDVAHYRGEYERHFETHVAGVRMRTPMMDIHTVAAGGGSILRFENGRYRVGPDSAGASPGPACYGRGGPLCVTDAHVILGRIQPQFFPQVFGPMADQPLDTNSVREKFEALACEIEAITGDQRSSMEVAEGFLKIAGDNMAHAIKKISVQRGYDVTEYTLNCFGGAGGQHAGLVAEALGIKRIFTHPFAGVLSAYGMGLAEHRWIQEQTVEKNLEESLQLEGLAEELIVAGRKNMEAQGVKVSNISFQVKAHLRYEGTDTVLTVGLGPIETMIIDFKCVHKRQFGFEMPNRKHIVESLSVEAIGTEDYVESIRSESFCEEKDSKEVSRYHLGITPRAFDEVDMYVAGEMRKVPVYKRKDLARAYLPVDSNRRMGVDSSWGDRWGDRPEPNDKRLEVNSSGALDSKRGGSGLPREELLPEILGPAIIVEDHSTIIVEPYWKVQVCSSAHFSKGGLVMSPCEKQESNSLNAFPNAFLTSCASSLKNTADPVLLEVFNNLFMSIAEQMGEVLRNTSCSVNIKERLDFSCALFNKQGDLVANAPHIPVHLGSMSESVKSIIKNQECEIKRGDVFALNSPYKGGTHLPDITVVTPVFEEHGEAILFYVACRGHHAEIGGKTPGSMPSDSQHIDEEGVLIDNFHLVDQGHLQESDLRELFMGASYPTRNFEHNLGDLKAQVAANEKGVQEIYQMVRHFEQDVVISYMKHVQDNAEECVRQAIDRLSDSQFECEMDSGVKIKVNIKVQSQDRSAIIDFTGTSSQQDNNFNIPYGATMAAVLYSFRLLVDQDIPLNAGCLKPLKVIIPKDCILRPQYPAAVVAGNVETSQAIVDAILGALGLMGASQGTMNNLTFGNDKYQYYETLCGGAGAGPHFHGADAVHTHMTNTQLTDPEVLEWRFPVILESFKIRQGSGGQGQFCGGDGVVRRIRFLEPMTLSLLSGRRRIPPYGLKGGRPGALGRNSIECPDGSVLPLQGVETVGVQSGDVCVIETPGGGGYGL